MSHLHKLFKELKKLTEEERDLLSELVRESNNVERICKQFGIEYSNNMLINYLASTSSYRIGCKTIAAPNQTTSPNNTPDPTTEKMKKIIIGDNLDIIEEAAQERGLI